ncbi:hypothetical protein HYC85_025535 [Camellia sinensis]|uniref:Protein DETOXIFICATION n=1 Tax=Camellia sinensis TaxID=4442 RepID=A0A7J7GBA4_CAMSI|nr:hypothetical protein HYC85_025535 [Camellia sinensis]
MNGDINEKLLRNAEEEERVGNGGRDETFKEKIWRETKKMWVVAGPAIFTRFSTFGINVISQAFVGHIGPTELAGFALVFTVLFRFANGILLGMASALETLCGQAYGAKQYHMLGVYLQRSWIILFVCSICLLPIFIFTTPILKALGQEDSIAEMAGTIARWLIPVVFSFIPSFTCQMFLQAQSKNMIIAYLAAFSLSIHVLLSWLLTVKYKYGIPGAMISTILAFWIPNIGQLAFVICGGCPETWKVLELWYNTILVLLTGNMVNAEVAIDALSICLNINGWEMMISVGFLAAARRELKSCKVLDFEYSANLIHHRICVIHLLPLLSGRLAYIFTESPEVAAAVADLSPLLACSILLNSIQPVLSGVAVGAGWQSIVAYVNIACYYLVGVPVGVGVWIGMLFGTFVQTIVLIIITYKTDWDKQVSIAKKRINKWFGDINEKLLWNAEEEERVRNGGQDETLKEKIWRETKKMWVVAAPAIFTRFSTFGINVISQAFVGHIGPTELAGYALVYTVLFRFANGILLGMASALETLCGQAYGAKQYHMLGVYLQRSWIVLFICSICLLPIFIFATPILKALGQEDSIAEMAGTIARWSIPVVFSFIPSFTCQMFLQAQSKNMIIAYLAAFSLSIHVLLSWLLTAKCKYGIPGAMISTILAFWIPNIGQLAFVICGGCPETWKGFSFLAFKDLWPIIKLSFLNIDGWEMMISFGFLAAASVRVSNELGGGSSKAAKFSILNIVLTSFTVGLVFFIFFLSFRGRLAYIFTESSEVAAAVADLSPLLACSILLNSIQPVLSGVAVGAGWQSIVAYVNITCYYLVGIPGVWIGMLFGTFVQTIVLSIITYKTDWDKQVSIAKKRINKWFVEPDQPGANPQNL